MKRSAAADLATLNRVRLIIDALIEDWPETVRLLADWEAGYRADTLAGGTTGGDINDLSGRVACGCPDTARCGHAGIPDDRATRSAAELGHGLHLMLTGANICRAVTARHIVDPAPTNWCRGGACPTGNLAARGCAGRCNACHRHWYRSSSHPDGRWERGDRERSGAVA